MGRLDRTLHAVRDAMTPGQRWTAALALALAIVVMGYGAPRHVVRVVAATTSPPSRRPAVTPPHVAGEYLPSVSTPAPLSYDPSEFAAPVPLDDVAPIPLRTPPGLVALVEPPAPSTLPGHSDADIAKFFLADASLVAVGDASCALAGRAGWFVTVRDLPDAVRSCLSTTAVVVAHDHAGTTDVVVSTRPSVTASLRAMARPSGRVGVVASARLRSLVQPALRALGAASVWWVSEDSPHADISAGARAFAAAGVNTVVFVVTSSEQAEWAALQSTLSPGLHWLVADAFDAGRVEQFPPVFDGARLTTTARGPWSTRANGDNAEQRRCRAAWQSQAGFVLDDELPAVYGWCQLAALRNLARTAPEDRLLTTVIRGLRYSSPLTSPLGPDGAGWGPQAYAELVWRARCSCWSVARNFAPAR